MGVKRVERELRCERANVTSWSGWMTGSAWSASRCGRALLASSGAPRSVSTPAKAATRRKIGFGPNTDHFRYLALHPIKPVPIPVCSIPRTAPRVELTCPGGVFQVLEPETRCFVPTARDPEQDEALDRGGFDSLEVLITCNTSHGNFPASRHLR